MRRKCERCHQMFNAERSKRRFCSRLCSARSRPRIFYQTIGKRGMQIRYPDRLEEMRTRYQRVSEGLDPWQAFRAGASWQRKRGYNRAFRVGYAAGWEACTKELDRRSA